MKISQARLRRIIKAMSRRRVAVVGDWMLDRYIWGNASRLSPEAAVPVVDFVAESECLGGAGNVAANLAALGARVIPFGVIGNDEPARALIRSVTTSGMATKGLLLEGTRITTVKTRIIARHQQIVRVDREMRSPLAPELEERLIRRMIQALAGFDALVVSDYDKGVITDRVAARVLAACERLRLPAFVKPKWSRLPTYRGAAAIVCNRAEAGFLVTRTLDATDEIEQAGRALLAHFGCPAVVITRGEQGMSIFQHDGTKPLHISATSRELPYGRIGQSARSEQLGGRQVFDVTGAGDTVLATLALAVAAGASIHEAAVLANGAAGVVVGKLGTATLTAAEFLAAARALPS